MGLHYIPGKACLATRYTDADGPKPILFDVDEYHALDVQMSTFELTQEGIKESMDVQVPEPPYSEALYFLEGDDWDFIWRVSRQLSFRWAY